MPTIKVINGDPAAASKTKDEEVRYTPSPKRKADQQVLETGGGGQSGSAGGLGHDPSYANLNRLVPPSQQLQGVSTQQTGHR